MKESPLPNAQPDPDTARMATSRSARVLLWIALGSSAFYVAAYVAIALLRMAYPFELEWMEGGSLDNVTRVLSGRPLYAPPDLNFIPFIYPPLYFHVAAWATRLLGEGFLPLRLVSFLASLGCFALVFAIVRSGRGPLSPALLAVGLFAATFREGGAWFDIARVDSLFLALLLAAYALLRRSPATQAHAALAGLALALACLTKQTGFFVLPAFVVALAIADLRRLPVFLAVVLAVAGGSVWWIDRATDHWFRFYVFDLPRHHPVIGQLLRGFWIQDLLGPVGVALAIGSFHFFGAASRERARELVLDGLVLGAMILAGYLTRVRVGSYDNVVIPAYAAAAIACGLGLRAFAVRASESAAVRAPLERFVLALVLVQFAVLAYKPWKQVPTARDREAGEQMVASLERVAGEVWVPSHGYLAMRAGKPGFAHELAMVDVMRDTASTVTRKLRDEMRAALTAKRFGAVVLDHEGWLRTEVEPHYQLYARMFAADEAQLFWPVTGYYTRPDFVWMPRQ